MLTNEIKLLKQNIQLQEDFKEDEESEQIDFDEFKQSQESWQQYLLEKVNDCNIAKFTIDMEDKDLHETFVNAICSVFSVSQVYWPLNQSVVHTIERTQIKDKVLCKVLDVIVITLGPFNEEQQEINRDGDVVYSELAQYQK